MYKRLEQTEIERLDEEYQHAEGLYRFLRPQLIGKGGELEKMNYPLVAAEVWHDAKELVCDVIQMENWRLQNLRPNLISRYNNIDGMPFLHSQRLATVVLMCVAYMLWYEYEIADEKTRFHVLSYGDLSTYFDEEKGDFVDVRDGILHEKIFEISGIKLSEYAIAGFMNRYDVDFPIQSCYLPKKNARKEVKENMDDKIRREIKDYVMRLKPALKEDMVEKYSEVWDDILSDTEIYQKLKVTKDRNFKVFSKHAIYRIIGIMNGGKKYFVGEYDTPKLDKLLEPLVSGKESKYRHIMTSGSKSADDIEKLAKKYYHI